MAEQNKKVLVVDDSAVQAQILKRALEKASYVVDSAANGVAALEKLKKVTVDLIISDTLMPQMDGFQLCRECKSDDKLRKIPLILTTASYIDKSAEEFALKLGADRFILKSADLGPLVKLIEEVIREFEKKQSGELKKPAAMDASIVREHERILMMKLEEQMQSLQEAQSLGRIGNWECDVKSRGIKWSDEVFILYERDPALGPPSEEEEAKYYTPEQARILRDYAARAIRNGEEFEYDMEANLPGGKKVSFSAAMRPVKNENGQVIKLVGTVQDITERKEAEVRFRTIFDSASDGILLADLQSKKFYMGNPSICRMLGYGPDEIKGLGVMDIHPEKDVPFVIEQFEKQARHEVTVAQNLPVKRKDGSVFYADISSAPMEISGKQYMMGMFRDVTERKRAEDEQRKHIMELETLAKATIGRELKMIELEKEVNALLKELGREAKYKA